MSTDTYDPYGNITGYSGIVTTPLLFSGEYRDAESGLYYLRSRYYDPVTGQFMTRDTAVSVTMSPYAYVAGNPLNATDPSGFKKVTNCGYIYRSGCDLSDYFENWSAFFTGLGKGLGASGNSLGAVLAELGNACGNASAVIGAVVAVQNDWNSQSDSTPPAIRIAHTAATGGGALAGAAGGAEAGALACAAGSPLASVVCGVLGGGIGCLCWIGRGFKCGKCG